MEDRRVQQRASWYGVQNAKIETPKAGIASQSSSILSPMVNTDISSALAIL